MRTKTYELWRCFFTLLLFVKFDIDDLNNLIAYLEHSAISLRFATDIDVISKNETRSKNQDKKGKKQKKAH